MTRQEMLSWLDGITTIVGSSAAVGLQGVAVDATHRLLADMVKVTSANAKDPGILARLDDLLAQPDGELGRGDECALNILSAGLFGLLPGGRSLVPAVDSSSTSEPVGYRVNPFLHAIRKAVLATKDLDPVRRTNGRRFNFFPEFVTLFPDSVRKRVIATAMAHRDMGPKDDELKVLYSLGGFFDDKVSGDGLKVNQSGGTTCLMTARGIYHAAGAAMIGERDPAVNVPMGPNVELGMPVVHKSTVKDKSGHWVEKKYVSETIRRGEVAESVPGEEKFSDSRKDMKPHLPAGNIYFEAGHGDSKYLLRGGGALAEHVGIVVSETGHQWFRTVDGGQGFGVEVKLKDVRKLEFDDALGYWVLRDPVKGATRSYSGQDLTGLDDKMGAFDQAEIERRITTDPAYAHLKANYLGTKKLHDQAVEKDDKAAAERFDTLLAKQRDTARSLARQLLGSKTGQPKSIQGWWFPEQYPTLQAVGLDTLRARRSQARSIAG
jgi:hypothetical protein